jgi:TonB family protein
MRRIGLIAILLSAQVAFGFQSDSDLDVVRMSPDVVRPQPISRPEPKYSEEARRARMQGIVMLQLVVDQQGNPTQIAVISPLGYGLDENAVAAVSRWRFRPATKEGKPVRVRAQVEVTFRLDGLSFNQKEEKQRTAFNVALAAGQTDKITAKTLDSLRDLASQKYPPGLYLYGRLLEEGRGVPADPEQGFRLIQESAEQKYGPALYEVAVARLKGEHLDKDPAKGLDLMRSAARLGSRSAQLFLGQAYEKGDGVPVDLEKSRQNYRLCAAAGDAPCQFQLGKSLLADSDHLNRDYVQAIAWLQLASDHGIEDAGKILEQEDARLTPADIKSVKQLMTQLVHQQ